MPRRGRGRGRGSGRGSRRGSAKSREPTKPTLLISPEPTGTSEEQAPNDDRLAYTGPGKLRMPGVKAPKYKAGEKLFSLAVVYGGEFVEQPCDYEGGLATYFDYFSHGFLRMAVLNSICDFLHLKPLRRFCFDAESRWMVISSDSDLLEILRYLEEGFKSLEIYVDDGNLIGNANVDSTVEVPRDETEINVDATVDSSGVEAEVAVENNCQVENEILNEGLVEVAVEDIGVVGAEGGVGAEILNEVLFEVAVEDNGGVGAEGGVGAGILNEVLFEVAVENNGGVGAEGGVEVDEGAGDDNCGVEGVENTSGAEAVELNGVAEDEIHNVNIVEELSEDNVGLVDVAGVFGEVVNVENINDGGVVTDFIDEYDWSFLDHIGGGGKSDSVQSLESSESDPDFEPNVGGEMDESDVDDDDDYADEEEDFEELSVSDDECYETSVGGEGGVSAEDDDDDYVGEEEEFDELEDESAKVNFPTFSEEVVFNPQLKLGMVFESKSLFRKAITSLAINTKRSLKVVKNDRTMVYAKCKGGKCKWACHALKVHGMETFQIRKYKPNHTCPISYNVSNMSSSWLAERCLGDFQTDPNRNVKGWRTEVTKKFNVSISKQQAYRAKKKAVDIIQGVPDVQYSMLWDYAAEIRRSNPGSTCVLDVSEDGYFSKFYVCFAACKEGFKRGCRPFIGIDGCHLKGSKGGILLTAVGVDPANAIFPIGIAVVDIENHSTWDWFLVNLKHDLGLQEHTNLTIMSDKQKGLVLALTEVFPNAEHRNCVRHLHANFQLAGFKGLLYKNAMWKAARATTPGLFKQRMTELKNISEAAFNWFEDKDPRHWSMAFFKSQPKCDFLLNNICESFNSAIMDARDKSIITMIEWIRIWLMERFQANRDRATAAWRGRLPPKIKKYLDKLRGRTSGCLPIKSNNRYYQVTCSDGSSFAVDLELWKCSCRGWDLSGIPCVHALSAILHNKGDPELFVDPSYSMKRYKVTYEQAILPLKGKVDWGSTMFNPPRPPLYKRPIGRPKKSRKPGPTEKMAKQNIPQKCKNCGLTGHNKKTCTAPSESHPTVMESSHSHKKKANTAAGSGRDKKKQKTAPEDSFKIGPSPWEQLKKSM